MAVTNKRIKFEKNKRSSLVITEKVGKKDGREVTWSESSDEEDHLYQLIRGIPTAMVVDRSGQSKRDFVPKRGPIGRKFYKTDQKGFFEEKREYFFEDEKRGSSLSGQEEKEFKVSFDGSFARGFEGTEFFVSLPIINGIEKAEAKDYSPKRGEGGSPESKSEEERPRPNIGGGIALQTFLGTSDSEGEEELSKDEQSPPSHIRKVAWAWERRALRAEESLKRYQEGLMDRTGEAKLKDTLSFLLNSDSGIIDERNLSQGCKSTWEERAFDTMDNDTWVVLKVPQANRSHVLCNFCDGDDIDDKHWLEGPFSQNLTVRELLEYQRGSDRV
jgi:hypothetical protein